MEDVNIEKKKVDCEIQEPSVELKDSYLSALEEFHKEGRYENQDVEEIRNNFPKFLQRFKNDLLGINSTEGRVPQTTYWIVDKDGYAGRISIRHRLNEKLLKIGGHIGYDVRPSKRRNGYGEKALKLALPKARAFGLAKVLLTLFPQIQYCDVFLGFTSTNFPPVSSTL